MSLIFPKGPFSVPRSLAESHVYNGILPCLLLRLLLAGLVSQTCLVFDDLDSLEEDGQIFYRLTLSLGICRMFFRDEDFSQYTFE